MGAPRAQDEPDRTSETDASNIEELDIEGFCRCSELGEHWLGYVWKYPAGLKSEPSGRVDTKY